MTSSCHNLSVYPLRNEEHVIRKVVHSENVIWGTQWALVVGFKSLEGYLSLCCRCILFPLQDPCLSNNYSVVVACGHWGYHFLSKHLFLAEHMLNGMDLRYFPFILSAHLLPVQSLRVNSIQTSQASVSCASHYCQLTFPKPTVVCNDPKAPTLPSWKTHA